MSAIWEMPDYDGHEAVHFFEDRETGLRAIIAVHSTHLGPSTGGTRFWHYDNGISAISDALRLSRGMSYKNAMAGLPLGGGKGVVIANPNRVKSDELLKAFGRAIESLNGRYVTAEDVGMTVADMQVIATQTKHVSGLPTREASKAGGDPGPYTARGVFLGIKAAAKYRLGVSLMDGVHVALQGCGSVGGGVARLLASEGTKLTIADTDLARANALAKETGADVVSTGAIASVKADIFSPNALGAILNANSIPSLDVAIVAGGANNQIATTGDAARLHDRGILYAPDYVINAGGIINVGLEYLGDASAADVNSRIDMIPERLLQIWQQSDAENIPAAYIADQMAQKLIGR
jgi:leucine dehydrogenase